MKTLFNNFFTNVRKVIAPGIVYMLLFAVVSCNASKMDEEATNVSFTEFSLSETSCEWVNMEWTEEDLPLPISELIIINSDEELRNHIACIVADGEYTLPVIDFSRYTLLLARGAGGRPFISAVGLQQLSSQIYVMNVAQHGYVFLGGPFFWHAAIIINKLNEGDNVKLNVIE